MLSKKPAAKESRESRKMATEMRTQVAQDARAAPVEVRIGRNENRRCANQRVDREHDRDPKLCSVVPIVARECSLSTSDDLLSQRGQ